MDSASMPVPAEIMFAAAKPDQPFPADTISVYLQHASVNPTQVDGHHHVTLAVESSNFIQTSVDCERCTAVLHCVNALNSGSHREAWNEQLWTAQLLHAQDSVKYASTHK